MPASLIDTNILVYANNEDSPFHAICKPIVEKAINGEIKAAISVQNLIELYAVITDRKRVEHPLSPIEAKELVGEYKPKAQSIFDLFLVATMMNNNVHQIYTANSDHFKPFAPAIKAINPIKAKP